MSATSQALRILDLGEPTSRSPAPRARQQTVTHRSLQIVVNLESDTVLAEKLQRAAVDIDRAENERRVIARKNYSLSVLMAVLAGALFFASIIVSFLLIGAHWYEHLPAALAAVFGLLSLFIFRLRVHLRYREILSR